MDTKKLNVNIKEWYTSVFRFDELGQKINPDITFRDLVKALNRSQSVYSLLGVLDTTVRARCFMKLSDLTVVAYEKIYDKWISGAKKRPR